MPDSKIINILYTCNDKFIKLLKTSLLSVMENCKNKIHVYLLVDKLSFNNIVDLEKFVSNYNNELSILDIQSFENTLGDSLRINNQWPIITLSRLYLCKFLPKNIDKVIYLDCDTIVNDDITKLWKTDLDNKSIAGVRDCVDCNYRKRIGLAKDSNYFNSGVLIFNLKKIRKVEFINKIIPIIEEKGHLLKYPDQDIINIIFGRDSIVLDMRYNVISQCLGFEFRRYMEYRNADEGYFYSQTAYYEALNNPGILHMTSGFMYARPWYEKSKHPFKHIFHKYYCEANGEMDYWGRDNRTFKQKIVYYVYRSVFPGKWRILKLLRLINNR